MNNCKSCGTELQGKYCHECGQKVLDANSLALGLLLKQATTYLFSVDSKLLVSLKLLFLNPGQLSKYFEQGLRVKYMKPFQLFVIANLTFFLLLFDADVFRNPSKWFFQMPQVAKDLPHLIEDNNTSQELIAVRYDTVSANISKGAISIMIPLFGLVFFLFNLRKKKALGAHFVFGIHFFSFLLFFMVVLGLVISVIPHKDTRYWFQIPMVLFNLVYLGFAYVKFYEDKVWIAVIKSVFSFASILAIILLYREQVSMLSLYHFI